MATSRSRQLLHRIALLAFVVLLGTGIWLRDVEAILFAVAVLVGVFLLPLRNGLLGRIVLALVFIDTIGWMAPAAFSNLQHHDSVVCVAIPVALGAIALAGLIAAVGVGARVVPLAVLVGAVGLVGIAAATTDDGLVAHPGDVRVSGKNVHFKPERLRAHDGTVTVVFKNRDLFWHTFTMDALDVDLRVPVKATRRMKFDAAPGTYHFYCAIPGHDAAGMHGTLTVS